MKQALQSMSAALASLLGEHFHSIWLYGSAVLEDFRPGWSDIDILVLTRGAPAREQAEALLMLRQKLTEKEPGNPLFRAFEGIIADWDEYKRGRFSRLVYWGTSGQRITDRYEKDVFAQLELARFGRCVYGEEDKGLFSEPSREELIRAIRSHLEGIRRFGTATDESLYSCGWLLDISRCLYSVKTGDVLSKTAAGQWALEKGLCPEAEALEKTLAIRRSPLKYRDDSEVKAWLKSLGPRIQRYGDVLEKALQEERAVPLLRIASPADRPRIEALFKEMLRAIYQKEEVKGYESGYLDKFFGGGEDRIYVAEQAGEVIAFLSVEVYRSQGYVYLDDLSVTEGFRGRGIGTGLIRQAERYTRSINIPVILFHVEQRNQRALRLYKRLGYEENELQGSRIRMVKDPRPDSIDIFPHI